MVELRYNQKKKVPKGRQIN